MKLVDWFYETNSKNKATFTLLIILITAVVVTVLINILGLVFSLIPEMAFNFIVIVGMLAVIWILLYGFFKLAEELENEQ